MTIEMEKQENAYRNAATKRIDAIPHLKMDQQWMFRVQAIMCADAGER